MNARYAKFSPQLHDPDRENVTRDVPDPPSPQNPIRPQQVTEIQQVMNMMNEHRQQIMSMLAEQNKVVAEQNRMTCSNWIIIANDIAHNKALFIDHKTKIDQAIQDLTVRITRLETANSIQPPTQNSTTQPKDTEVPKMCYHCDQITAQGLTDVIGKPLIKEFHLRQKNQKFAKFSHPENCAQFMSLSVGNRAKVLSAQGLCIACAGKHGAEKVCSMHWIGAKRPKSIRCCYVDRNSNEQCNYHISLCKDHLDFNIKELTDITQKLGLPKYPVPHQIAMTIQTVEELDVDPGVVLKCPQPRKFTAVDTCYNSSHEVDLLQPTYPTSRKLLFVYTVRTNTNRTILVLADPGATLSILNRRAISLVGPCMDNGTTRLKGLSNNQVGPAIIKRFS